MLSRLYFEPLQDPRSPTLLYGRYSLEPRTTTQQWTGRDVRTRALVARTGVPLPPPSGPARMQYCLVEGYKALTAARRLNARAEALLELDFPWLLADAPGSDRLHL